MVEEMIDYWEFHYWSKHVPNDSVHDLIALVRLCATQFKSVIDYTLPSEYKNAFDSEEYTVQFIQEHDSALVTIKHIGD